MHLVDRYDLRAADALQLAAVLVWCEDLPQGGMFLTADQKLQKAAMLGGGVPPVTSFPCLAPE